MISWFQLDAIIARASFDRICTAVTVDIVITRKAYDRVFIKAITDQIIVAIGAYKFGYSSKFTWNNRLSTCSVFRPEIDAIDIPNLSKRVSRVITAGI